MSKGGQVQQGGAPAQTGFTAPTAQQTAGAPASSPQGYGINPYQQASQGMQQAFNTAAMPANAGAYMQEYANPFQEQVIDRTIGRMNDVRDEQLSMNKADAIRGGAFGGARHGLIDARTYDDYQQNVGDMVANMSRQGFDTAANLANRDIANRMGQSQMLGGLAGQAYGMGNQINQAQMGSGQMVQALQQALLGQSQGMFDEFTSQPEKLLQLKLAALGMSPLSGNRTTTAKEKKSFGLGDILGAGASVLGSAVDFTPLEVDLGDWF